MALSLRDQGEIAPAQASALADEQLDFVVQIWTVDGRSIYASRRARGAAGARAAGLGRRRRVGGQTWRTFSVATRGRVIQVAQPLADPPRAGGRRGAGAACCRCCWLAPLMALAVWWLAALTLAPLRRVAAEVRARDEQSLAAAARRRACPTRWRRW